MALGRGYIEAFDNFINRLIVEPLSNAVKGGIGALGGAFGAAEAGEERAGGALSWLKDKIAGTGFASSPSASLDGPSVAISVPAPSLGKFDVAMEDLGHFPVPSFGGASRSGAGIGM